MPRADLTLQAPVCPEPGRRHRPLPWLLLGSVALHALVLSWQPPTPPLRLTEPSGRSAALGLQLSSAPPRQTETPADSNAEPSATPAPAHTTDRVEPPAATTAAAAPKSPRAARVPPPSPRATAPATPAPTAAPEPRPVQTAATPAPRPEPAASAASAAPAAPANSRQRSAVLSEVHDALQRHFFYPRLARLRNWEGNVLLGFQVRSDGRIHEVEVLESSGRAVLDQAALSALRSVRQVAYNATRPVELQLPVAYRLH